MKDIIKSETPDIKNISEQGYNPNELNDLVANNSGVIRVIIDGGVSNEEIAELINHLSNIYHGISGDELFINSIEELAPIDDKK